MDDYNLDPYSPDERQEERAPGPFGVDEELPREVTKWLNRVHPKTKALTLKVDFGWERAAATRILISLQQYTHQWTLFTVKKREAFDRADASDSAQSLFVLDREARLILDAEALRALRNPPAAGADAAAQAAAATALRVRQEARIDIWIADAANVIIATDKPALLTACELSPQELVVFKEFARVYDSALCHFLPEVCTRKVGRFLNAERIRADNLPVPVPLRYTDYRKLLTERLRDSGKSNSLINYVLKTREEYLLISLWVAERRSERAILEKDGITLPEFTWLSFTLGFVTNDERIILDVPAEKDLAAFNGGAGYTMAVLETSLAQTDPDTFKPFRSSTLRDPVAKRILAIERLQPAEKSKKPEPQPKREPGKNLSSAEKRLARGKSPVKLTGKEAEALDLSAALPAKNGKPDASIRAKLKAGSLRARLWDAICDKRCIRCGETHRRHACKQERRVWEDDFDIGLTFWAFRQSRPQWDPSGSFRSRHALAVKHTCTMDGGHPVRCVIGIDTFSDIGTASPAFLTNVRPCEPITIDHVGGSTTFARHGELVLGELSVTLFAVRSDTQLPIGYCAILGMSEIKELQISIDAIMKKNYCHLDSCVGLDSPLRVMKGNQDISTFYRRSTPPHPHARARNAPNDYLDEHEAISVARNGSGVRIAFDMSPYSEDRAWKSEHDIYYMGTIADPTRPHKPDWRVLEHLQHHANDTPIDDAIEHFKAVSAWGGDCPTYDPWHIALLLDNDHLLERKMQTSLYATFLVMRRTLFSPRTFFPAQPLAPRDDPRRWNPWVHNVNHPERTAPNQRPPFSRTVRGTTAMSIQRSEFWRGRNEEGHHPMAYTNMRPGDSVLRPPDPSRDQRVPQTVEPARFARAQDREPLEQVRSAVAALESLENERAVNTAARIAANGPSFADGQDYTDFEPAPTVPVLFLQHDYTLPQYLEWCWKMAKHIKPESLLFWFAALIVVCAAAVMASGYLASSPPSVALLGGNANNGHSLFDSPPYPSPTDTYWTPRIEPADGADCDPDLEANPHPSDPPEQHPLNCFVQLVSPSAFAGGVALKAIVQILPAGDPDAVAMSAGIDTLSDVTLATRELLSDIHTIVPDEVRSAGATTAYAEEGTLSIYIDHQVFRVPALVATAHSLPLETKIILGMPALYQLNVSIDEQKKEQNAPLICNLGEKSLRAWLDAHPTDSVDTKPFDTNSIDINPALPPAAIKAIRAIIKKYAKAFEGSKDALPKPFDAPPVELNFVPNPRPQCVPEPRWSFAYGAIVKRWAEAGLKNGSLEPSQSSWASRPHVVLKPPSGATAATADIADCKLRVCGDYRLANEQIAKLVPNLPTGTHQLEQAAGYKWYFETDAVACYSSFRLALGRSREALAIWTPIGLVQPTVLPFGQKNSGTEAQGPYREAIRECKNLSNYVDDFLSYSNDLDELIDNLEKFLAVCVLKDITLNTHKTRIGYNEATFYGFTVNADGSHLADKHLDPLRTLVPPTDISELRRVLGLFVVSRKYIKDYAMISKPMTDVLRGRLPQFRWGEVEQRAFDTIHDLLLQGVHLSAPDYDLPFHLATDASEDGKGGMLYQLPSVPIDSQYPYSPRTHHVDNVNVVQFLSKAWTDAQRARPPFYLEADALLWAQVKTMFYALSSPFPFYTYSDHLPLQWMNKSTKGPVSQFIIENLSELDVIHQYVPGKLNSIPDATSRHPLLGPRRISPQGLQHSVQILLDRLPESFRAKPVVHAHAGIDTPDLHRLIQAWRTGSGSVQPIAPTSRDPPAEADLAIMVPRPEIAPVSLALYLLSDVPFAVLLPVDLATQINRPNLYPNAPTARITAAFATAGKITLLHPQMIWIMGNFPNHAPIETFSSQLCTPAPLATGDTFDDPMPQTLEDWTTAQQADPEMPAFVEATRHAAVRDGLHILALPDQPPRIMVPPSVREALTRTVHKAKFHLGAAKIAATLKLSYFWPSLAADVRRWLANCPDCELQKARQAAAHGLFTARPWDAPRSRWALDFQGQGTAITGETQALAFIDTSSRYVEVLALPDREATTFIGPFLDRIVFRHGTPDVLHSDAAPEFMSDVLRLLAEVLNTATTTTMGHNAQANATIEVFWRYWNRTMRILPDEFYHRWPEFVSRITYAYNTAPHESLGGVSPFEIYHGVPARDPFVSALAVTDMDAELATADLDNPQQFADAVRTSATAFTTLARHHSTYVRETTAARLNLHGHPRTYTVGAKVKIRVPPSHEQMLATGRRSSHITAWRGPCSIVTRFSNTAYAMTEDSTGRSFERTTSNILPYRSTSATTTANFDPIYSDPFVENEIIAVRDEPGQPYFIARVIAILAAGISVHYYGSKTPQMSRAIFRPGWHALNTNDVTLSTLQPPGLVPYTGTITFDALRNLIVARNLELQQSCRLRRKSLRILAPVKDDLFIF